MDESLLDTDILNEVLKQRNANVVQHAAVYLSQHADFAISSITRYEVLRGLKERNAVAQLGRFHTFCRQSIVLPVSDDILDRAADLWVEGRRLGMAPKDADLIIAATAMDHDRTLATGNTPHFQWITGLRIVNWRDP